PLLSAPGATRTLIWTEGPAGTGVAEAPSDTPVTNSAITSATSGARTRPKHARSARLGGATGTAIVSALIVLHHPLSGSYIRVWDGNRRRPSTVCRREIGGRGISTPHRRPEDSSRRA